MIYTPTLNATLFLKRLDVRENALERQAKRKGTTYQPSLQEEFAPLRGSATGVVARVESLRGRMSEGERQVEGLFESLLSEVFDGKETR